MKKETTRLFLLMLLLILASMLGLNSAYQRQMFIGCLTVFSFIIVMLIIRGIAGFFKPINRDGQSTNIVVGNIEHPPVPISVKLLEKLNKKGTELYQKKRLPESLITFKTALEVANKVFGMKHSAYLSNLKNIATVYCSLDEYDNAESFFRQALDIAESLGKKSSEYDKSLTAIAKFYKSKGEYDKAEPLYRRLLENKKTIVGKKHPEYLLRFSNLGMIEILNRKFSDGFDKLLQVSKISDLMIAQMFSIGDEKKIQEYIRTIANDYFMLLSVFSRYYSELKKYTPLVLDVVLKRKAISLEMKALRRDKILLSQHQELQGKFEELRENQKKLASRMMEGAKGVSQEYHQRIILNLEKKIESLEKELAARIPEIELYKKLEKAEHGNIASLLPEDTKLIEFVCYRDYDVSRNQWRSSRYLAFVLSKHDKKMIDLGEASDIDNLIKQFRNEIAKGERTIIVVPSKTPEEEVIPESEEPEVFTGKLLYEKIFKPISDKIGYMKKLFIASDGNITLIPFEVLPLPNGRYVVEDFEISYLDSGRDILRFGYQKPPQSCPMVVFDPDFDLAGEEVMFDTSSKLHNISSPFHRLHGTKTEGEAIRKILQNSDFLTGKDVLDEQIKQLASPEILHIATHGFFISDHEHGMGLFQGEQFENPLLRSGLALAGANTFLQKKNPEKHAQDGLLTALDVTGMDLTGTDLVVLSACETGLGEVRAGEGIYGLRRAFAIAGARTLIVSLWKVPDQETKELMVSFYTKISNGKGKAEALRESQREMIQKLRKTEKSEFFWGAFVCVGEPGNIG